MKVESLILRLNHINKTHFENYYLMKKLIAPIIIGLLLIANLGIIIKYKYLRKGLIVLNTQSIDYSLLKENIKDYVFQAQMNENVMLDTSIILKDGNEKIITLKKVFTSEPKIVFRIFETGCSPCLENELNLLKKYLFAFGADKVVIITTHSISRKLLVFKKMYNIDFDVYYCKNLGVPYEKEYNLFIFVSDSTLLVKHFFIPNRNMPELSDMYYLAFCKRYYSRSFEKSDHTANSKLK